MKAVGTVFVWLAAGIVALWLVRRLRRGERALLNGRWSPRFVRTVAVILVMLGWRPGDDPGARAAEPEPACTTLAPSEVRPTPQAALEPAAPPLTVARDDVGRLVEAHLGLRSGDMPWRRGAWTRLKQVLLAAQPSLGVQLADEGLSGLVRRQLDPEDRERYRPERLHALLLAAEAASHHDAWLTAYAFEKVGPTASRTDLAGAEQQALAALFAVAERHARVTEAVIHTMREVGVVRFRPWMSKAGAPRDWVDVEVPPGFRAALDKHLATASAGTWASEATLDVEVVAGGAGATLLRYGQPHALTTAAVLRFRRLDVLVAGEAPLVLRHATLGSLSLPPGQALTAWNLPARLGPAGRAAVDGLVKRALACDRAAQGALQQVLPAAHAAVKAAVDGSRRDGDGQPALAMLWALFVQ